MIYYQPYDDGQVKRSFTQHQELIYSKCGKVFNVESYLNVICNKIKSESNNEGLTKLNKQVQNTYPFKKLLLHKVLSVLCKIVIHRKRATNTLIRILKTTLKYYLFYNE